MGDEAAYRKLEGWLAENGYRRYAVTDVTASDDKLSLTWANPAWDPAPPKGGFEYGVRHTGVSMRYDSCIAQPQVLGVCIPGGLREFLLAFDEMLPAVQAFATARTKHCNGCGYCTQTDKTGTRPKAFIPVKHGGKTRALCTYFPGYSYCWTQLDDPLAENIIALLAFMDSRLVQRKPPHRRVKHGD